MGSSFVAGKVIREGMGQATGLPDSQTLDLIITNALIIDWSGIYKVRALLLRAGPRSLPSFAGRHWDQEPPHCWYRQGRQPRRDGWRDPRHDRWRQHGGYRGREAHHHRRSDRHTRCVLLYLSGAPAHAMATLAVHYVCPQLCDEVRCGFSLRFEPPLTFPAIPGSRQRNRSSPTFPLFDLAH